MQKETAQSFRSVRLFVFLNNQIFVSIRVTHRTHFEIQLMPAPTSALGA